MRGVSVKVMFAVLVVLFIVAPLVEITVIVEVAHAIGGWNAIGLLVLISIAGAWLTRYQGWIVYRRVREQLDAGHLPGRDLIDGALVLAAGMLMVTPGFVTDAIGLLLLLPPTRAIARALLSRRFARRVTAHAFPPTDERDNARRAGSDGIIDV